MNIIEESFTTTKKKNNKLLPKIILAFIILLVIAIIGVVITLAYIEDSKLKISINGKVEPKLNDMFVFEEDTTYVSIRDIAPYLGYQSYSGDYAERSEAKNKCYIQSENEIANFVLASEKIYKLEMSRSASEYKYFYSKRPVKSIGGKLYVSTDGMENAFNVSYIHNKETNRINIYTMDYLLQSYDTMILDSGYTETSQEFNDMKSIFESRLIVENDEKEMGVIDLDGNVIIEPKYEKISYIPETGDFYVVSNGKIGVISKNGDMRIQILYDSLNIIDVRGNLKLYIENDQIGIDISAFEKNDIRNGYLLVNNLIPVKKGDLWGLYNKNGQKVVDFQFDSFGYVANSNKDAMNLLVIPNYNVMVTCKDGKYGLINSSGEIIFPNRADDIYFTIESGKRYYYLNYNNNRNNVEDWLDSIGVKATTNSNTQTKTNTQEQTSEENETTNN